MKSSAKKATGSSLPAESIQAERMILIEIGIISDGYFWKPLAHEHIDKYAQGG